MEGGKGVQERWRERTVGVHSVQGLSADWRGSPLQGDVSRVGGPDGVVQSKGREMGLRNSEGFNGNQCPGASVSC